MTDSHCHLASARFSDDELPDLMARGRAAGVRRMVTLATDEEDVPKNVALAEAFSEVFACVGIHPCDVQEAGDDFEGVLQPYLSHPRVVAIGETGLDYFHPAPEGVTEESYRARQRDFLRRHFELASQSGLGVVIHTRDRDGSASLDDALAIYQDYSSGVQAVFHCFPGPLDLAQRVMAAGALVSFTGVATFKNATACLEAARHVPTDRMMVETDSPYLAPVPHRGQRCEPAFVAHTAQRIAEAKGMAFSKFIKVTDQVCDRFFRFPTA